MKKRYTAHCARAMAAIPWRKKAMRWFSRHGNSIIFCSLCLFFNVLVHFIYCLPSLQDSPTNWFERSLQAKSAKTETSYAHHAFLAVVILTGPINSDRRDVIRSTWLSNLPDDVRAFFVVGTSALSVQERGALEYENAVNKDLVLLPDFQDKYSHLTEKLTRAFAWMNENVDFNFVFKADDDTFARVPEMLKELRSKKASRFYWGYFDGRARVKQTGQWAERRWKLCDHYLPHARGGGYVLSRDLVQYIAENAHFLQKFNSEDISVGAWLGPLDVNRFHDTRFDTEYKSRGCSNGFLVTHKQDVKLMREKHQNLVDYGRLCREETRVAPAYVYNWNVPPSQCCVRLNSSGP